MCVCVVPRNLLLGIPKELAKGKAPKPSTEASTPSGDEHTTDAASLTTLSLVIPSPKALKRLRHFTTLTARGYFGATQKREGGSQGSVLECQNTSHPSVDCRPETEPKSWQSYNLMSIAANVCVCVCASVRSAP